MAKNPLGPDFDSGQVVNDRYRILECVGIGGMGVVFKVVDLQTNLTRALKVLASDHLDDDLVRKRFANEKTSTQALDHPNIVRCYNLDYTKLHRPFITMDFIDGGTVAQRIEANGLRFADALFILRDTALALSHAHAKHIIHRDLKPENLLLDVQGKVKVSDFGLARNIEIGYGYAVPEIGATVGTPMYMAPEQYLHLEVDHRSDIYSLGIIAFQMASGSLPFTGTKEEIGDQHCSRPLPDLQKLKPDLAPWYVELVSQCAQKNRTDRVQSMSQVVRVLETGMRRMKLIDGLSYRSATFFGRMRDLLKLR